MLGVLETSLKNKEKWMGVLGIFASFAIFHLFAWSWVERFYRTHLPHYDSIGSYTAMFEILNAWELKGFVLASQKAGDFFLSWLQAGFALIGAPFLEKTPQSMQLYNSVCVLALMISIYALVRSLGGSARKSVVLSWIAFTPDVFFESQGGLMDLQRDPSFLCLLAATFFSFVAAVFSRNSKQFFFCGTVAGLCVLSRGNALFLLIGTMGPVFLYFLYSEVRAKSARPFLKKFSFAVAPFLVVAGPNVIITLQMNADRYKDRYVFPAFQTSPLDSFGEYWHIPFHLFFGHPDHNGLHSFYVSLAASVLSFVLLSWMIRRKKIIFDKAEFHRMLPVLWGGIWFLLATYIVICGMVGWSGFSYHSAKHPFYPSLVFFFSALLCIFVPLRFAETLSKKVQWASVWFSVLLISCIGFVRGEFRIHAYPQPPEHLEIAHQLSKTLSKLSNQTRVAFFWFETLSFDTVLYFSAQNGLPIPEKFRYKSPDGTVLDFAVAAPSKNLIPGLIAALKTQVESDADYLIVNTRPNAYSQKTDRYFVFSDGQEMVSSFLKDPTMEEVYSFVLWRGRSYEESFKVLRNTRSLAAKTK